MHKNLLIAASLLSVVLPSHGAIIAQELFDNVSGGADSTLNGKGDTASSVGMTGTWLSNGNTTTIFTASNFNVDGGTLPGLSSNAGAQGGIYRAGASNFGTNLYATRQLTTTVDFNTSQTIYFSVRLRNHGDTAMGIGLASGANGAAEFVGAGFHWNTSTGLDSQNSANAAYISYGTLDQNLTGANDGVYASQAHETAGSVNGYGLLVGRITINSAGNDVIEIKRYAENSVIDSDLSSISWSATSSVNSSMNASHLLLWMNGNGGGELDAIRLGTTWQDVTGVTPVPEPAIALLGSLGVLGLLRRRR